MADPVPDVQAVTPWYADKSLYAAVLTPVFLLLNQKFGLTLDPVVVIGLVLPVVAFIVGHKWKSGVISVAQVAAKAAADAPGKALNG